MDALFEAVGVLFDQVEYVLVESKEDMQNLIDPPDDENYEPKKVKHNILGDLLDEITAEAKEEDQE
jgi:broad-specificity NMP kinase